MGECFLKLGFVDRYWRLRLTRDEAYLTDELIPYAECLELRSTNPFQRKLMQNGLTLIDTPKGRFLSGKLHVMDWATSFCVEFSERRRFRSSLIFSIIRAMFLIFFVVSLIAVAGVFIEHGAVVLLFLPVFYGVLGLMALLVGAVEIFSYRLALSRFAQDIRSL